MVLSPLAGLLCVSLLEGRATSQSFHSEQLCTPPAGVVRWYIIQTSLFWTNPAGLRKAVTVVQCSRAIRPCVHSAKCTSRSFVLVLWFGYSPHILYLHLPHKLQTLCFHNTAHVGSIPLSTSACLPPQWQWVFLMVTLFCFSCLWGGIMGNAPPLRRMGQKRLCKHGGMKINHTLEMVFPL